MRKYIFIAIGGMLGAISRFAISDIQICRDHGNFPLNTLLINISGSFLLALILTIAFELLAFDEGIRLGIATGFLGAYTTFSTFCKQTVRLLVAGEYFSAISYIILSTLLGLAAVFFGAVCARAVLSKHIKDKQVDLDIIEEGDSN